MIGSFYTNYWTRFALQKVPIPIAKDRRGRGSTSLKPIKKSPQVRRIRGDHKIQAGLCARAYGSPSPHLSGSDREVDQWLQLSIDDLVGLEEPRLKTVLPENLQL